MSVLDFTTRDLKFGMQFETKWDDMMVTFIYKMVMGDSCMNENNMYGLIRTHILTLDILIEQFGGQLIGDTYIGVQLLHRHRISNPED